jgi:hypothetical protein
MQSICLLGDSILDNAPYTRPEPDTTTHLQRLLTACSVERRARDGARMRDVEGQLRGLATKPSVAILSVGGNDAVEHIGLLEERATSSAQIFEQLNRIANDFAERYEPVARAVREWAERAVLCTIYEVQLEPAPYARLARTPLAVLNDRIIRIAGRLGADVLELRSVCTEPGDFVLQIEPSARGALKIARAIAGLVTGDGRLSSTRVYSATST